MNKKLHFLLFCLAVIVIIYLCKDKLIEPYGSSSGLMGSLLENFRNLEPFGNQIVIHPDNSSFEPQETTFSVLTYDSDLGSGVTQVSTCSDDSSWRNGDKTCRDYSLEGTNCEDIGSDGRLAFDACKVACDNCNTYTEVKRRLPSPMEDTDEPSYAQFEGSMSSGDMGSDIGGPDYREIIGKLDDLSGKIDSIEVSGGSTEDDGGDTTTTTIQNKFTDIQTILDGYITTPEPGISQDEIDQFNEIKRQINDLSGMIGGLHSDPPAGTEIKCKDDSGISNVTCEDGDQVVDAAQYISITGLTDEEARQRCCTSSPPVEQYSACSNLPSEFCGTDQELVSVDAFYRAEEEDIETKKTICCQDSTVTPPAAHGEVESETCSQPTDDSLTGYSLGGNPTFSITGFSIPNLACDTKSGYGTLEDGDGTIIDAKATACSEGGTAYTLEGCYKTSFCRENEKDIYDVHCMPFFFTDKEFEKGDDGKENIILGQDFDTCCENNVWGRRSLSAIILGLLIYNIHSKWEDEDYKFRSTAITIIALYFVLGILFTDIIPVTYYYIRKWTEQEKEKTDLPSEDEGWSGWFWFIFGWLYWIILIIFISIYNYNF